MKSSCLSAEVRFLFTSVIISAGGDDGMTCATGAPGLTALDEGYDSDAKRSHM
ncbi:hypothetical protein GcC1_132016 [Golovinomyces cichoracearum]|uniref:Uncharacterized protein n=1 Tax=Golovinomyces cichoracearum TaxID=62708 RepID=A0A420I432_9PEZI|nr:hypothetical protein GcC1_132016 [Golovinomyces cichoracearum]